MAQVMPCCRARPVSRARGEERRARVRSGAIAGVTTVIRTLFPCPPIRFPGSLCISSTLDEINSLRTATTARFHGAKPRQQIRRSSESPTKRDSRTMFDWCQDAHGRNFASSCTRAGRVCNNGREASSGSRGRAPTGPLWRLVAARTLVRKTSPVDHAAAR